MPVANNAAKGAYRQVAAALDGQQARLTELGFVISNRIEISAFALVRAAERLQQAEESAKTYELGLDNERIKRRLGMATLIDLVNLEDRYNAALLAVVFERQAYAGALAQLWFEAGFLVQRDGNQYSTRIGELLAAEF